MIKRGPKATDNFTVLHNDTLEAPLSPEALGLWVYLLSKPEHWQVRAKQLQNRFNIGKDRYQRILRELTEYGVLTRLQSRDGGKFGNNDYLVTESPLPGNPATAPQPEKPLPAKPSDGKTAAGKPGSLVRTDLLVRTEEELSTECEQAPLTRNQKQFLKETEGWEHG